MVRYRALNRSRRYVRNAYLSSACDPIGFGANLVSPALPKAEDYINHTAISQNPASKRQNYRSNFQSGYELWAVTCITDYFTPPHLSPVPGDEDYDEDDHKDANEEPIDENDQKTLDVLYSRGSQNRFYRRNGGIYSESRQREMSDVYYSRDPRDSRINVIVMSLDRSGKNAMVVQKHSKARGVMVEIALIIDIPGPGSDTWAKEGGGGWWGTARETEKLLAVTCRLRMQTAGNGLGVMFGLVTGGTRVRFFKWTADKKEKTGGRFEDLAVLLGFADDEEDYDSFSDDGEAEIRDTPHIDSSMNDELDVPSKSKDKGKGKAKFSDLFTQDMNQDVEADHDSDSAPPSSEAPPHHTSQIYHEDPDDLFDIRLPPETSRGGYYDMLWQGDKCSKMFHYIGGYKVD